LVRQHTNQSKTLIIRNVYRGFLFNSKNFGKNRFFCSLF